MNINRRALLGSVAATAALPVGVRRARAQANSIKIGVLNDMSGPYRDISGPTSVAAVKMAVDEFAAKGFAVEVLNADHQNKPDVGASIAAQSYDRDGVDMIIDVPTSSVGLAVGGVAKEKNKLHVVPARRPPSTRPASGCAPSLIHYTYDTYMLAKSIGGATVRRAATPGTSSPPTTRSATRCSATPPSHGHAAGGKVLGSSCVSHPRHHGLLTVLLQAKASGAKVIGFVNAGTDTVQQHQAGAPSSASRKPHIAAMLMFLTDVHALGLNVARDCT